jgi:hypothetical protein
LLVFSPPFTSGATKQLVQIAQPKYVALHHVHRMFGPLFALQQRFGARLIAYLASLRGFALLELPSLIESNWDGSALGGFESDMKLVNPRVQIQLADDRATLLPGNHRRILVTVMNLGEQTLSPRYASPVALSYHWMTADDQVMLWDGVRSPLPFDILPGCAATVEVRIGPAPDSSCSIACVTLVQEFVGWFDESDPSNRLLLSLNGDEIRIS